MTEPRVVVLDTSVVIEPPHTYLYYADELCISAVTVGELAFGLHGQDPGTFARRDAALRATLEDFDAIPYDAEIARAYGALAAAVRAAGRNPRSRTADLQIAATALHLGVPLLTRNADDLKGLERMVEVIPVR